MNLQVAERNTVLPHFCLLAPPVLCLKELLRTDLSHLEELFQLLSVHFLTYLTQVIDSSYYCQQPNSKGVNLHLKVDPIHKIGLGDKEKKMEKKLLSILQIRLITMKVSGQTIYN